MTNGPDDGGTAARATAVIVGRGSTVLAARAVPAGAHQTAFRNVPSGAAIYVLAQSAHGYGAYSPGLG